MDLKQAVKIIDDGWVRKRKGFRVHFQRRIDSELVTEFVPDENQKPMDSEIAAWRLAWKLFMAAEPDSAEPDDGKMVNIYVVDDLGNPVKYYGTNQLKVFNPID